MFAAEIRKRRVQNHSYSRWRWHLEEVFVRINGETRYLRPIVTDYLRSCRSAMKVIGNAADQICSERRSKHEQMKLVSGLCNYFQMKSSSVGAWINPAPETKIPTA